MAALFPILALAVGAGTVLVAFQRRSEDGRSKASVAAALASLAALVGLLWQWSSAGEPFREFSGFLVIDRAGVVAGCLVCLACLVTALLLPSHLAKVGGERCEVYALLLLAAAGMLAMVQTDHLVLVFLGLETFSVCLYALSASLRDRPASIEAGLKYFLTGAFASGILVFGMALLYGESASFSLPEIHERLKQPGVLSLAGLLLVLVGFGFKVSAAPFHMWAPDVYEGAPTPITGFMSTAVKVAAFVALFRVLSATVALSDEAGHALAWIACITVFVGNLGALAQQSAKRLLAYSSIAHAGYVLLAAAAYLAATRVGARAEAFSVVLYYVFAYTLTNLGAFAVLSALEGKDDVLRVGDLAGLKSRNGVLAGSLLVMMLSLASVPLTAGFVGKWGIFEVLVDRYRETQSGSWLVMIAVLVLGSVVGLAYYLRIVRTMYFDAPPEGSAPTLAAPRLARLIAVVLAVLVLWAGAGPDWLGLGADGLLGWVRSSAL